MAPEKSGTGWLEAALAAPRVHLCCLLVTVPGITALVALLGVRLCPPNGTYRLSVFSGSQFTEFSALGPGPTKSGTLGGKHPRDSLEPEKKMFPVYTFAVASEPGLLTKAKGNMVDPFFS